jgi:hypothetical protein
MFCPALRSCLFISLICVLLAEMDSSFKPDRPDNDPSTAFGTETLAEGYGPRGLRKYPDFEDGHACRGSRRWEVFKG